MSSTKLSIGIVGLPNVGKSTLFNALTKKSVDTSNYPFCTIDPSVGVVPVPDDRLRRIVSATKSKEIIPAVVEFVDIAGLVKGASHGEGLGNQFLSHIRGVDAMAEVVRVFEDENVSHVHGSIEPVHDIDVVNLELVLADLQVVSSELSKAEKSVKAAKKDAVEKENLLGRIAGTLEKGKSTSAANLSPEEKNMIKDLGLLSLKPVLYVLNTKSDVEIPPKLKSFLKESGSPFICVDAKVEEDIKEMDEGEKKDFRKELGASESDLDNLIKKSYEMLDLITFFTVVESKNRAWAVRRGSKATEAGAVVHTDFQEKFIKAEVINWKSLVGAGSFASAREKGLIRTEGKDYVVEDGDVIEFKI